MCNHIGDCSYQELEEDSCNHWDGKDCRNGEKLNDDLEYRRELLNEDNLRGI